MTTEIFKIQEAYLGMYPEQLNEEVHKEIQDIMDSESVPLAHKLNAVTKKARSLIASGQDTGMESDKPKKGSSRAVFFPKEHKEITVDGVKTKTPTAVKIAFPGQLDKYHEEDTLLGEDQNELESDRHINHIHGILRHADNSTDANPKYETNPHGILAPVFSTHPDHHHLEMGRVEKADTKSIAEATKTKEFPKGLKLDEISGSMLREHQLAHGQRLAKHHPDMEAHMEKVREHPWVDNAISMMQNSGMHPGDINKQNIGIYTHPVTGKKHLAIIDYGFSNDVSKKYTKARTNLNEEYLKKHRRY